MPVTRSPTASILWRSENLPEDIATIVRVAARDSNLKCPFVKPTDCSSSEKYRRVDWRCNNLNKPLWGASFTPMARDLPAEYDRGIQNGYKRTDLPRQTSSRYPRPLPSARLVSSSSAPLSSPATMFTAHDVRDTAFERGIHNGYKRTDLPRQTSSRYPRPLPSARLVSNIVHSSSSAPLSSPATMAFVFFGQFTAHDVTDTAFERGYQGAFLDCCKDQLKVRGCASIPVPAGDFFGGFGRDCLSFSRAKEVTDLECKKGTREQLNMVSSFVDGSNMYGHTEDILLSLRDEEGKLKISEPNQLPFQQHPHMAAFEKGFNFMNAGDERVSEVSGLTGITTVWHREHNRVAQQLAKSARFSGISNAKRRSNAIFEEARKIVVAFKQHITYNEFLRLAIGPDAMTKFSLEPLVSGYFNGYDPKVNPAMRNEVVVSAQRLGHSLLRNMMSVLDTKFSTTKDTLQLKKIFWRPNFFLKYENGFLRGFSTDAGEVCDRHIADDVRDHLFETQNGNGEDLIARNIQRGRDHGVDCYNSVRREMGLHYATEFTTRYFLGFEDISDDAVSKFRMVYRHPEEVDLFTGGISEAPVPSGIVGPLFSQMLGRQFQRLKVGDRFWYESPTTGFTSKQLDEIRKVSMSYLMCQNVDGITTVQKQLFKIPTFGGDNDRVSCGDLLSVDLTLWH